MKAASKVGRAVERKRHQLTVDLGAGERGALCHRKLVEAAERAGKPTLSAWVLELLRREVGQLPSSPPSREEHVRLIKRIEWLEEQLQRLDILVREDSRGLAPRLERLEVVYPNADEINRRATEWLESRYPNENELLRRVQRLERRHGASACG